MRLCGFAYLSTTVELLRRTMPSGRFGAGTWSADTDRVLCPRTRTPREAGHHRRREGRELKTTLKTSETTHSSHLSARLFHGEPPAGHGFAAAGLEFAGAHDRDPIVPATPATQASAIARGRAPATRGPNRKRPDCARRIEMVRSSSQPQPRGVVSCTSSTTACAGNVTSNAAQGPPANARMHRRLALSDRPGENDRENHPSTTPTSGRVTRPTRAADTRRPSPAQTQAAKAPEKRTQTRLRRPT